MPKVTQQGAKGPDSAHACAAPGRTGWPWVPEKVGAEQAHWPVSRAACWPKAGPGLELKPPGPPGGHVTHTARLPLGKTTPVSAPWCLGVAQPVVLPPSAKRRFLCTPQCPAQIPSPPASLYRPPQQAFLTSCPHSRSTSRTPAKCCCHLEPQLPSPGHTASGHPSLGSGDPCLDLAQPQ